MSNPTDGERLARIETTLGSHTKALTRIERKIDGSNGGIGHSTRIDRLEQTEKRRTKWTAVAVAMGGGAVMTLVVGWVRGVMR